MTKRWQFILTAAAVLTQILSAQIHGTVTLSETADDNVNNSAVVTGSSVSHTGLTAGYWLELFGGGLDLSYDGAYQYYGSALYRTNSYHSGEITFQRPLNGEESDEWTISAAFASGDFRDEYSLFDHSLFTGMTQYKYPIGERFIHTMLYSGGVVSYPGLQDFSYSEHRIMTSGAAALTPTTTLILQADLGAKFYGTESAEGNSAMRKGMMSSVLPSVSQLTGMMKVGQQITENIGLSLSARYQWNIRKQTRYLETPYGGMADDELFDDHYGYEGWHTSMMYTHLLTETMTAKVTAGVQQRIYSSLAAFDLTGTMTASQREDSRRYLNLTLKQEFPELGVTLHGTLDLIDNVSNDAWYDYRNTVAGIGITVPF